MRKTVPLIFALAVVAADPALACKELAKDQASAAVYLLQQQSYVVKRCVSCPDERREMVKVGSVALSPAPAQRWTVTLNGAPVDIEEVYLRIDPTIAVSLAHLVRCTFPTDLPAQISMKSDAAAQGVAGLPEGVTPQKIHHVNPEYPALARQARIQGKVILDAVIEKDGSVTDVRIVESPHPMLDEPSIAAVQQWRYKPILIDGVPTRARVTVTTTFGLK
jgi:TonB family protein